jgi:hypothetical protein
MNITNTVPWNPANLAGGTSQQLALTTTPAQSAALGGNTAVGSTNAIFFWSSVSCFIRGGTNPTCTTDGTDVCLPPNVAYRIDGLKTTDKLSVAATAGTGTCYITPL